MVSDVLIQEQSERLSSLRELTEKNLKQMSEFCICIAGNVLISMKYDKQVFSLPPHPRPLLLLLPLLPL